MSTSSPLTLDDLVLARLRLAGEGGALRSEIDKALRSLGTQRRSPAEWKQALAAALERILGQGLSQSTGRSRFTLTPVGQRAVADRLGLPVADAHIRWERLCSTYLIARTLALPVPTAATQQQRLMNGDGLRAAIFWSHYQLPFVDYPSLTAARDRLLWRHLFSEGTMTRLMQQSTLAAAPFTQGVLMTILLNDLLGAERELDWQTALKQLAAKLVSARRTTPDALRIALLARAAVQEADALSAPTPRVAEERELDYPAFASDVLQAAGRCRTGRFGKHKVFISHVWHQLREEGTDRGLSLDAFKHHLLEAMRRSLLVLTRADMGYALDQADVAASSVAHLTDTLHFVRLS